MLVWEPGYDGESAKSERYEYAIGGRSIGGFGVWLAIYITRKKDNKMYTKIWYEEVPVDPKFFCEAFEDGYVILFPWEWSEKKD